MHADGLGQVLVTVTVIGHQAPHYRQYLEGIGIVGLAQQRTLRFGKLQHQQPSPRLQHPQHRAQGLVLVSHVAQAEGDGDAVEAVVGKGQVLGIGLDEFQVAQVAAVQQLVPPHFQHGLVDIGQHHRALGPHDIGEPRCQVACAAGDIQYGVALAHAAELDGEALPDAVYAGRHKIVHEVVTGGHGVKDVRHHAGLGLLVDFLEAEMGSFLIAHGCSARTSLNVSL